MKFLTPEVFTRSLGEMGSTLLFLLIVIIILEVLTFVLWYPLGLFSRRIDNALRFLGHPIRHLISTLLLLGVVAFVVASVSVGQNKSTVGQYWPLALVAFLLATFLSPNAPAIFRPSLRLTYMLLLPALVGILVLWVFPLLWEVNVSFTNLSPRNFRNPSYVGLNNYAAVFTRPVLKQVTFWPLFFRTVLWTVINVVFTVLGGMGLALLMNRPMKLRGLYRMFIVFPWAIPQVIAVLAWRGEFHFEYGFVNIMLTRIGEALPWLSLGPVAWKTNPVANFSAMIITNIWLGIPFMMVIILGGLQSIAGEYYEAAEIDGASTVQRFRNITLPLLRPVLTPAIILGTIWTFNNFNVPFFINENELETSDTLVTALFRAAFEYFTLGRAAAFAFVLFGILLIFAIVYIRATGGVRGAYE